MGPIVLFLVMGTLSLLNNMVRIAIVLSAGKSGWSMVRRSSRSGRIHPIPYLFFAVEETALENCSKLFELECWLM